MGAHTLLRGWNKREEDNNFQSAMIKYYILKTKKSKNLNFLIFAADGSTVWCHRTENGISPFEPCLEKEVFYEYDVEKMKTVTRFNEKGQIFLKYSIPFVS